jgi:tetratricopeptide (TPR) repeat protein
MALQILTSSIGNHNTQIYRYVLPHIHVSHDRIAGGGLHINDQYAASLVFKESGYYEEAKRLLIRVLGTIGESGRYKKSYLSAAGMLATTYRAQGRWHKAERLQVEVLEQWKKLSGQGNLDVKTASEITGSTINAMVGLAATYTSQDRHAEAERLKLEAIRLQTLLTGRTDPETMTTMANLAVTYSAQGRHEEAESLELEVFDGRRKLLGKDNPDTIQAALNLAITYREQGKLKRAEELLFTMLERAKKVMGENHPTTICLAQSLAATYGLQNRDAASTELELEVVQRQRKMLGKDHPGTVTAVANLAVSYFKQHDFKRALPLLVEAVPATLRIWGSQHAYSRDRVDALAFIYEMLGQHEKARIVKELLK